MTQICYTLGSHFLLSREVTYRVTLKIPHELHKVRHRSTLWETLSSYHQARTRSERKPLHGLELILVASSTPTQSQKATQEQYIGHQPLTIQWLSQFNTDRNYQTICQVTRPSDRNWTKADLSGNGLFTNCGSGPTCQHELAYAFSWKHTLHSLSPSSISFATLSLSL